MTWTFNADEFWLSYRLAPESSRAEEKWSEPVKFTATCSVRTPCRRTIMGLSKQQYAVKLNSYHVVEAERRFEDSHGAIATPK